MRWLIYVLAHGLKLAELRLRGSAAKDVELLAPLHHLAVRERGTGS
ncbi:hypothetical protein OG741_02220 [Streptomyces sp. NBC_01410]